MSHIFIILTLGWIFEIVFYQLFFRFYWLSRGFSATFLKFNRDSHVLKENPNQRPQRPNWPLRGPLGPLPPRPPLFWLTCFCPAPLPPRLAEGSWPDSHSGAVTVLWLGGSADPVRPFHRRQSWRSRAHLFDGSISPSPFSTSNMILINT